MPPLLSTPLTFILRLLSFTYRYHYISHEKIDPNKAYVLAIWHQNILAGILSQQKKSHGIMVSKSKDADLVAIVLKKMGHFISRGSARNDGRDKGGLNALNNLKSLAKKNIPCALAIDGPKGPAKKVKAGVIAMALELKIPIIPYTPFPKSFWSFPSWDRFIVPKPFSKIIIYYGNPYHPKGPLNDEKLKLKELMEGSEKIVKEKLKLL